MAAVLQQRPTRRERIIVIDDDPGLAEVIVMLLSGEGYRVENAATVRAGLAQIAATEFDLVITDLKLPDGTGLDVIRQVKDIRRDLPIILMTSYSSMESAIGALRHGAVDYIVKPFDNENFLHATERALNERRVLRENAILKRNLNKVKAELEIIGKSEGIRRVIEVMRKVAPSDATVLIRGESGTGKELVAVGIHMASPRGNGPFVSINCGAVPAELLESELFGHAKGAFTGATHATEGLIREAHGGTLFLDEISELAPQLQVKLLRVLQEREVRPVGGKHVYKVDVRFIAATNRDLAQAMAAGRFREDLFYRLNVIDIHVPPLRERADDVRLLAQHFIDRHSRRMGKRFHGMSSDLGEFLARVLVAGQCARTRQPDRARRDSRRCRGADVQGPGGHAAGRGEAHRCRRGRAASAGHSAVGRGLHAPGGRTLPGPLQRDRPREHARNRPQGAVDAAAPVGPASEGRAQGLTDARGAPRPSGRACFPAKDRVSCGNAGMPPRRAHVARML